MKRNGLGLAAAMLVAAMTLTACGWLAKGSGGGGDSYAYSSGSLKHTENVSLDAGFDATVKAVEAMGFRVGTKNKDAIVGQVDSMTADNRDVKIKISKLTDTSCSFNIRVATGMTANDQTRANAIMDEIKKNLPAAAPTPAPTP